VLSFRNALETQSRCLEALSPEFGGTSLAHELFVNTFVVRRRARVLLYRCIKDRAPRRLRSNQSFNALKTTPQGAFLVKRSNRSVYQRSSSTQCSANCNKVCNGLPSHSNWSHFRWLGVVMSLEQFAEVLVGPSGTRLHRSL
jgi:hypothetical protein